MKLPLTEMGKTVEETCFGEKTRFRFQGMLSFRVMLDIWGKTSARQLGIPFWSQGRSAEWKC